MEYSESESSDDVILSVMIDNGTYMIKAGFGGDDAPRAVFPTVFGKPKNVITSKNKNMKEYYIGDEAMAKRCYFVVYKSKIGNDLNKSDILYRKLLELTYPIKSGEINDWDMVEKIWKHTFENELRIEVSNIPVMLTEKPLNTFQNRKKMTEIMFETFEVPKMFIVTDSLLALYASGRELECTSGVLVSMDYDSTNVVPIYDGFCIPYAIKASNLGGKNVTEYTKKLLNEKGYNLTTTVETWYVRDIKEKLCYVAEDFEQRLESEKNACTKSGYNYELPDGTVIETDIERFSAPEVIFKPNKMGLTDLGLDKLIINSIKSCDNEIKSLLCKDIILSGGNSMFPDLDVRLLKELKKSDISQKIKIGAPPERMYSTWIGGSMICCNRCFDKYWVTKEEYKEYGRNVVYRYYL